MSALREQAFGIINVCKTVIAGKIKDQGVDNQTIAIAQEILTQAKAEVPEDKVLAAVDLKPPVTYWTTLLSAMEIVDKSLPTPEAISMAKTVREVRKRTEAYEGELHDAIETYKAALKRYEQEAARESPSYTIIEAPKLKIADAVLRKRGIPTGPNVTAATA